jgi:hypothetical protein
VVTETESVDTADHTGQNSTVFLRNANAKELITKNVEATAAIDAPSTTTSVRPIFVKADALRTILKS